MENYYYKTGKISKPENFQIEQRGKIALSWVDAYCVNSV